jgi:hypothetical protein
MSLSFGPQVRDDTILLRTPGDDKLPSCLAFFNGAFFLADSDPPLREILFASIIPVSKRAMSNEQ